MPYYGPGSLPSQGVFSLKSCLQISICGRLAPLRKLLLEPWEVTPRAQRSTVAGFGSACVD